MSVGITQQEANEIKMVLDKSEWRNSEKTATQVVLVSVMISLIMFALGIIFWDMLASTLFKSIGILSLMSFMGMGLQIYSYSSDSSGRGAY